MTDISDRSMDQSGYSKEKRERERVEMDRGGVGIRTEEKSSYYSISSFIKMFTFFKVLLPLLPFFKASLKRVLLPIYTIHSFR
jgi:hypothetical protein